MTKVIAFTAALTLMVGAASAANKIDIRKWTLDQEGRDGWSVKKLILDGLGQAFAQPHFIASATMTGWFIGGIGIRLLFPATGRGSARSLPPIDSLRLRAEHAS